MEGLVWRKWSFSVALRVFSNDLWWKLLSKFLSRSYVFWVCQYFPFDVAWASASARYTAYTCYADNKQHSNSL